MVRAARICSAGHGGQILISETTRALLGNDVPERVSVRDLGRQHLKDVQYEHVYELSLDESRTEFPPLKESRGDAMEDRFAARINAYVEEQLEQAFSQAGPRPRKDRRDKRGCLFALLVIAAAVGALVLLVQLI